MEMVRQSLDVAEGKWRLNTNAIDLFNQSVLAVL